MRRYRNVAPPMSKCPPNIGGSIIDAKLIINSDLSKILTNFAMKKFYYITFFI